MKIAAHEANDTVKKIGVAGLIRKTKDCYRKKRPPQYYCTYLDMAGVHIDHNMSYAAGIPLQKFYSAKQLSNRFYLVLQRSNKSNADGVLWLISLDEIMGKLVKDGNTDSK